MYRLMRTSLVAMPLAFSIVLASVLANAQVEPPKVDNPEPLPPVQPAGSDVPPPPAPTSSMTAMPPPALPPPPVPTNPAPQLPVAPAPAPIVVTSALTITTPALPSPKITFPTRSLRMGPSLQTLLYEPFPYEKISRVGTGVFGVYEFYLKPSFAIGINLSYRYYPGNATLHQVGYGLMLKHYLGGMKSPDSTFMPFVEYGLLLQINKLSTREGTGTAHDTRLSAGTDIRIAGKVFFIEGSWHYSRVGLFEQTAERLDNLEFNVGYRYPW